MTTAADRILVDTNVLVYVSLRNFAWHAQVPATGTTLVNEKLVSLAWIPTGPLEPNKGGRPVCIIS